MAGADLSDIEIAQIAREAYTYFYPIVLMEMTRRALAPTREAMATLFHGRTLADEKSRAVVRPNHDTLYSIAWIDLSDGPYMFEVPKADGRYFMFQLLDLWTDTVGVIGSRSVGDGPRAVALVGPGWTGPLPDGVFALELSCRTIWMLGRIYTWGGEDLAQVHRFQDGLKLSRLDGFARIGATSPELLPDVARSRTSPMLAVEEMDYETFFALGVSLLTREGPHPTDWSQLLRLARIGLVEGNPFDAARLSTSVRGALQASHEQARAFMRTWVTSKTNLVNGWSIKLDTIGVYANSYVDRAITALRGLGANPVEDAVYPMTDVDETGARLDGGQHYVWHVEAQELPPVDSFWSITTYDSEGFLVGNDLHRFCLGNRDELVVGDDGSVDLYFGPTPPERGSIDNWLPTSSGRLNLTLRLYDPKPEVLDGRWRPPAVRRIG
jgi:hypothetical protein